MAFTGEDVSEKKSYTLILSTSQIFTAACKATTDSVLMKFLPLLSQILRYRVWKSTYNSENRILKMHFHFSLCTHFYGRYLIDGGEEILAELVCSRQLRHVIQLLTSFCAAPFHTHCSYQINKGNAVKEMFWVLNKKISKPYRINYYHRFRYRQIAFSMESYTLLSLNISLVTALFKELYFGYAWFTEIFCVTVPISNYFNLPFHW